MSTPTRVTFNSLADSEHSGEREAVRRVFDSGWLILGEEVRQFEQAWAKRCGVDHAIGVGNGLDAIEIGLRAAGIEPGHEVITTPITAAATVLGIIRAGATPVLADIDPTTALMDLESVKRCMTPATRAVLLVHLYGHVKDMHEWVEFCQRRSLDLMEDCAQSHDASLDGRVAGSWGRFGAYSFYPTKNLGAAGDAGALVTDDSELAALSGSIRNYGQSNRYEHPHFGLNSRLDEMQAAILSARLPRLAAWTTRRRQIADTYREQINNPAISLLAAPHSPENHVHHLFVLLTDDRRHLQAHLADHGVETLIHYPIPVHQQPPLMNLARDPAGLAQAETHSKRCLSIPCAPHLTDDDLGRVIAAINDFRPRLSNSTRM